MSRGGSLLLRDPAATESNLHAVHASAGVGGLLTIEVVSSPVSDLVMAINAALWRTTLLKGVWIRHEARKGGGLHVLVWSQLKEGITPEDRERVHEMHGQLIDRLGDSLTFEFRASSGAPESEEYLRVFPLHGLT